MSDKRDYEVGYRKPPKAHQFKQGQSGNPKGRRKGVLNFRTDVRETLKAPVAITEGGLKRTVSTQGALLLRLREKALKGDPRAMDRCLELARAYSDDEVARNDGTPVSEADRAIIDRGVARRVAPSDLVRRDEAASSNTAPEPQGGGAGDGTARKTSLPRVRLTRSSQKPDHE